LTGHSEAITLIHVQGLLADRLETVRRRRFVGRAAELARFAALLDAPPGAADREVSLLAVHGPAGVGKSTLVRRFADLARERGLTVLALDARDLPGSPDTVAAALEPLSGGAPGRALLAIDTYELLAELDDRLRRDLLPRLPADTLVVLAGRYPPAAAWRTDPGWAGVLETMPLRNLSPDEARRYLDVVGVAPAEQQACLDFTHGYPLALALAGEIARTGGDVSPRESPDLVRDLLDRLLDDVLPAGDGGDHRLALEACAQVRVLTEPLLARMLGRDDVAALFAWLRGLPVVEQGPAGLLPHDLAREALVADLRWRDARRDAELHARARSHYLELLPDADPAEQQRLLLDLMYLHEGLRVWLDGGGADAAGLRVTPPGGADAAAVAALVEAHEGVESAALARLWLDRRPECWQVVRGPDAAPAGAMLLLPLHELTAADADDDPAVAAAFAELARRPPLRDGERATHLRFWLAADTYQAPGPVQSVIAGRLALHYLTTGGLALTLMPFADPAFWDVFCAYTDFHPMPAADFTVGGRAYGVYGHDWRAVPLDAWVGLLAGRETAGLPDGPAAPSRVPDDVALLVMSRDEFAASVRDALRDLQRPDRLARSPLLRSRLVTGTAGGGLADGDVPARVAALRAAIAAAARAMESSPRDAKGFRAVNRTYLHPAGTHEKAAEVLGLPSSTFRRHLAAGLDRLVEILWDRELHQP
jgi:hypothetical protein